MSNSKSNSSNSKDNSILLCVWCKFKHQIAVTVCHTADSQNSAYVMTPNPNRESRGSTLNVAITAPQRLAKLVNLVMFVLWSFSMGNLLQAIPRQPCHILAWFCRLSYTNNWALEFYAIYLFFGWHLWQLGWPLSIMCVQAISQGLMVRKISWGQYSVKGNLGEGASCK
jgi:hypothetical protein